MLKKERLKQQKKEQKLNESHKISQVRSNTVNDSAIHENIFYDSWGSKELILDDVTNELVSVPINERENNDRPIEGASLWSETEHIQPSESKENKLNRILKEEFSRFSE